MVLNLPAQFTYQPEIINKEKLKPFKHIIIAGMGGSRMAPDILTMLYPELDIHVCSSSYLPGLSDEYLSEALVIANSHSGNTKEILMFAAAALQKGLNVATVSTGGELASWAIANNLAYIITPARGEPARLGVGSNLVALMTLLALSVLNLGDFPTLEQQGKELAEFLAGGIPVVYMSHRYNALGYMWKVILNETANIPAFCNRYPELFHNEVVAFDSQLSQSLRYLIVRDGADTDLKRVNALVDFLKSKNISCMPIDMVQGTDIEKIFLSFVLAHWTALALAEKTGVDAISTPAIDEFKKTA